MRRRREYPGSPALHEAALQRAALREPDAEVASAREAVVQQAGAQQEDRGGVAVRQAAPRHAVRRRSGATQHILRCRGVTLLETMVVLAIAAILVSLAVPSFTSYIDRQKLLTTSADLYAAVNLARAEALRRGSRIELVPIAVGDWKSGWEVRTPGAASTLLYRHPPVPTGVSFASPQVSIAYDGFGHLKNGLEAMWTVSVGGQLRIVSINATGRPLVCDPLTPPCP